MTRAQLAEIKARVEKASPGPWEVHKEEMEADFVWRPRTSKYGPGKVIIGDADGETSDSDYQFIAHARQDIPALLKYVEELERDRDVAVASEMGVKHSWVQMQKELVSARERNKELEKAIRSAYESPSSDEAQSILSVYANPR